MAKQRLKNKMNVIYGLFQTVLAMVWAHDQ